MVVVLRTSVVSVMKMGRASGQVIGWSGGVHQLSIRAGEFSPSYLTFVLAHACTHARCQYRFMPFPNSLVKQLSPGLVLGPLETLVVGSTWDRRFRQNPWCAFPG